jgi:hypothetical protein
MKSKHAREIASEASLAWAGGIGVGVGLGHFGGIAIIGGSLLAFACLGYSLWNRLRMEPE